MESFGMLYETMKDRNKKTDQHCRVKKKSNLARLYVNEFRAVIVTVLIVTSALTMQRSISDFLETTIKNRFKDSRARNGWMFILSLIFTIVTISVLFLWKPLMITEEEEEQPIEKVSSKPSVV